MFNIYRLSLLFLMALSQSDPVRTKCLLKNIVNMLICSNKSYVPEDIIIEATNKPISLQFLSMREAMHLKIPTTYFKDSYGVYNSFTILESCVESIEVKFFSTLDKDKNKLKRIKFSKVKCLQKLQTKSFAGLEKSLEKLYFDNMPELVEIESDFFNQFEALKELSITFTQIASIPAKLFQVLTVMNSLKINNNQLTSLPLIVRNDTIIQASGNPLNCVCSLMNFINLMPEEIKSKDYICATPSIFNGKPLNSVGDLCNVTIRPSTVGLVTTEKSADPGKIKESNEESVSTAKVRLEIIASISAVLLLVVIIIIIVVIIKQKKRKPNDKFIYNDGSPSKILYQHDGYNEPFLNQRNQML